MMKLEDVKKIAIIGGGSMGHGCAMVFAGAGYPVGLYSRRLETLEKAVEGMRNDLTFLAERGLGKLEDVEPTMARVTTTQDMAEAAADADFVLECVAEDMALKQDTFQKLDQMCKPDAILATNTSVMSPTEIASTSEKRGPDHRHPLVEPAVPHPAGRGRADRRDARTGSSTSPWTCTGPSASIRCTAKKDVPGFIANRLQHALWREAISIVERGIADAATVDESLKYGPGLRLPVLAPLRERRHGRSGPHAVHTQLRAQAPRRLPRAVAAPQGEGGEGRVGLQDGRRRLPDLDAGGAEGASQPPARPTSPRPSAR